MAEGIREGLDLSPIHSKYHDLARAIHKDARPFVGRLVWFVPTNSEGKPDLVGAFPLPDLEAAGLEAILTFWRDDRGDLVMYVFLYLRVSGEDQATRGSALEAGFAMQLRKCAARGIKVAGLAMDVGTGSEAERPAMRHLEAALMDGPVKVVVTPLLDRVDRNQENFSARLPKWGRWGVLAYYGKHYEDTRFDFMLWSDFDSRDRGVMIVRIGEQYLVLGRKGRNNTMIDKLAKRIIGAYGKTDNFVFYNTENEDKDPNAGNGTRQAVKAPQAANRYAYVRSEILAAADAKDWPRLLRLVLWARQETGKDVTLDSLMWELRVGWIVGVNRVSPDWLGTAQPCPDLTIEPDGDRHTEVLLALDRLLECRPHKLKGAKVRLDEADEFLKSAIAEFEENRSDLIRLGVMCFNTRKHDVPQPVRVAHTMGDLRQQVYCPVCTPRASETGRTVVPKWNDLQAALVAPRMACIRCGRRKHLELWDHYTLGVLKIPLYKCIRCKLAPAAYGDAQPADGQVWLDDEADAPLPPAPVKATTETPKSATPRAGREAKPKKKQPRDQPKETAVKAPKEVRRAAKPEAWLRKQAPPRIPGKPWLEALPGADTTYASHDLTVSAVANRMLESLMHHRDCNFEWEQVKVMGVGTAHPNIWSATGMNIRAVLSCLRRLAKAHGVPLTDKAIGHRSFRYFWIAASITDVLPNAPSGATLASPVDYLEPPNLDVPERCPYDLYDQPIPEQAEFYEDTTIQTVVDRILVTLLATPGRCFATSQLQVIGLGKSIPPGPHPKRVIFNNATRRARGSLEGRGMVLDSEQFSGSKQSTWWIPGHDPKSGNDTAAPAAPPMPPPPPPATAAAPAAVRVTTDAGLGG